MDVKKGRTFWRWIREESSLTDWLIALFTIVLAGVSILQWLVLSGQLSQMRSGSIDTHALAVAAHKQAAAADKFSTSAASINTEIKSAVGQITSAVGDLQRIATASERSIAASKDVMRLDQRAWVGVIESTAPPILDERSTPKFGVTFGNSGRTPALKLTTKGRYVLLPRGIEPHPAQELKTIKAEAGGVVQPGGKRVIPITITTPITKEQAADLKSRAFIFYVFGEITYNDIFRRPHWITFCLSLATDEPIGFTECDYYNDAN